MKDLEKYWPVIITIIAIIFVLGLVLLLSHIEQANAGDLPTQGQKLEDKIQDHRLIIDHGKQAHTFRVKERSLLEYIKEQLEKANSTGKIKDLQQEYIANPKMFLTWPE